MNVIEPSSSKLARPAIIRQSGSHLLDLSPLCVFKFLVLVAKQVVKVVAGVILTSQGQLFSLLGIIIIPIIIIIIIIVIIPIIITIIIIIISSSSPLK